MDQIVQVFGSLLILIAFFAAQRGRLATDSPTYLWLNLVGSVILAVLASPGAKDSSASCCSSPAGPWSRASL